MHALMHEFWGLGAVHLCTQISAVKNDKHKLSMHFKAILTLGSALMHAFMHVFFILGSSISACLGLAFMHALFACLGGRVWCECTRDLFRD